MTLKRRRIIKQTIRERKLRTKLDRENEQKQDLGEKSRKSVTQNSFQITFVGERRDRHR